MLRHHLDCGAVGLKIRCSHRSVLNQAVNLHQNPSSTTVAILVT
jgi:hypothetical protein